MAEASQAQIMPHLQEVAGAISGLPLWVYQQIRQRPIEDIVRLLAVNEPNDNPEEVITAKKPVVQKRTSTKELDQRVAAALQTAGTNLPIGSIVTTLEAEYGTGCYNVQKVRRSLVRLQDAGIVVSEGKTKTTTYKAASAKKKTKRKATATSKKKTKRKSTSKKKAPLKKKALPKKKGPRKPPKKGSVKKKGKKKAK